LSDEEKQWIDQISQHITHGRRVDFMVVNAGVKDCFPAKAWPVEYYQEVVTRTAGFVQWVQVGAPEHHHPTLHGVINLIGQTNHRQFVRLVWHSKGGLGPVTYLQHLCAGLDKPYICLLGGREPATWVQYPLQHTLHTMGLLDCCRKQACWKSKVEVKEDGDEGSLCERPYYGMSRVFAKCMAMIQPDDVIRLVSKIGSG
jgi:ADP-heptose:LPS heptosyltransferase